MPKPFSDIEKRIKELLNQNEQKSNCMGTAMYVFGILERDIEIEDRVKAKNIIDKHFTQIKTPKPYSLLTLSDPANLELYHIGILTPKEKGFGFFHRIGSNETVRLENCYKQYITDGYIPCMLFEQIGREPRVDFYEMKTKENN